MASALSAEPSCQSLLFSLFLSLFYPSHGCHRTRWHWQHEASSSSHSWPSFGCRQPSALDPLGQLEKFLDPRAGFNWALFQVSWQGRLGKAASWQNPSVLLAQMGIPRWMKCGRWGLLQSLLRDGGRDYPWSAGCWSWGECHSSLSALFLQFSGLPHISELHNKSIKKALPQ